MENRLALRFGFNQLLTDMNIFPPTYLDKLLTQRCRSGRNITR